MKYAKSVPEKENAQITFIKSLVMITLSYLEPDEQIRLQLISRVWYDQIIPSFTDHY